MSKSESVQLKDTDPLIPNGSGIPKSSSLSNVADAPDVDEAMEEGLIKGVAGPNGYVKLGSVQDSPRILIVQETKASFLSCVINLSNTILGAGMLGLPHAFAESGYLLGTILLILAGLASGFGLYCLSESARMIGEPTTSSFYSVAKASVPRFAWLIDLAVVIKCFGVSCAYITVIGDLMPDALRHMATLKEDSIFLKQEFWATFYMITVMAPLSFLRTLNSLRYTSALAIIFVIWIVFIVNLFAYVDDLDACSDYENKSDCKGETVAVSLSQGTFSVLSIFVFSYTCHQNIFAIANEIKDNTRKRLTGVIGTSISFSFTCYILVAVAGYYTFGANVDSDIIKNYPADHALLTISRIAICFLVASSYPLQIHPCRASFFQLVFGSPAATEKWRLGFTTAVAVGTWLIAISVADLGKVLAVVGATGSTIISYILPGLVYFVLCEKWTPGRVGAMTLIIVGLLFMPVALTFIFLDA